MKSAATLTAAGAVFLCTGPALAVPPMLSGSYTLILNQTCQPTLTANFNADQVVSSLTSSGNAFVQQIVLASFVPSTGKVKFVGFGNGGSQFLLQGTPDGATAGVALVQVPISTTVKYSTGDASVTIHGESFKAIYGQIDKTGIAHTVAFLGIEQSGQLVCSTQGMGTRQR